jgi:rubrerythrin
LIADPIAMLRSPEGALMSIYLDRPSPGGFTALISDLGRQVKQAAVRRGREVEKSVDTDLRRLRSMAEQFESEATPAYALFASSLNGIWELRSLAHQPSPIAVLGSRPYLRPLRAVPRPIRTAILVADRSQARLFVGYDGEIEEICDPLTADIGKSNYGGFSGYAEHGVRARAQAVAARLWKEGGDILLERHQETAFDLLLVGGLEEAIEDVRAELHPYLRDLPHASFTVNPADVATGRLKDELAAQRVEFRRRRESSLVEEVLSAAARSDGGLLGLGPALDAVNAQGVADLIVAGEFARPGTMCPSCGYLDRADENCPVCGNAMQGVEDVISAAMDATVSSGGRVHQLMIGSALDHHGVGALTRFQIAAAG